MVIEAHERVENAGPSAVGSAPGMRSADGRGKQEGFDFDAALATAAEIRTLVLAALGSVAFFAISIFSIRDCDLLSGTGVVTLPLLDADVPIPVFFFAAPIFLALLFAYVHVDMRRVTENVPLGGAVPVWPLSELPIRKLGSGMMLSIITNLVVWGAWPAVTILLAWRVLPLGHAWLGPLNVTSIGVAGALTLWNFERVRRPHVKAMPLPVVMGTAALTMLGLAGSALVCIGSLKSRSLSVRYTDFKSADIVGLDLSGRDLREANFSRATLPQASLRGANLSRATFASSEVEYATFCGALLDLSSFRGARARNADFRCGVEGFGGVWRVDFTDTDLRGVDFATSRFHKAPGANLAGASFWRADIRNANLAETDVTRANFAVVKGESAHFDGARGSQTIFFKANLHGASFVRAQFDKPNFTAAELQGANFGEATLSRARLDGAILKGANLEGCHLEDADITAATVFTGATFDRFTKLPKGIDPIARGMVQAK